MEDNTKLIESLIDRATEYGKTSLDLVKLHAVDKASDGISSFIPHAAVFLTLGSFLVFLNLGIAFWLGEILGETFYGFFAVAGFYAVVSFVLYFFMRKWIKRFLYDSIIKKLLN